MYTDSSGNSIDAYEAYRQDQKARKRVVLVGANDGMLHAFFAGDPDTTQPDLTGSFPYSPGTGEELWAFVPPDLLPKLRKMVDAHQYMVDGSVMLRDIWVDGIGSGAADRQKQKDEFRTVAIFGRRSGGTQYTALDVTDPTSPKFLWNFPGNCSATSPQTCGDDARYMGQSWADFAPRPPPIVPVKLADSGDTRGFAEKWIVMINGGYDPALTLGRAVFMVDAWTGKTIWRFTDDDFKTQLSFSGKATSMFPVPAAVGMVDIGDTTAAVRDSDGFFDTATWGDLGGNLFVARFQTPGAIGASGRVENWFAARTFEERRQTNDSQGVSGRSEFYYMTANTFDGTTHTLRTFLGSGNREQIMQQSAACGADNLMGCCQAGCAVTATTTESYGGCGFSSAFDCTSGGTGVLEHAATTNTCSTTTGATCAASPGNAFTSSVALSFTCPGGTGTVNATGSTSCDVNGVCTVTPVGSPNVTGNLTAPPHSRFYGVWAYGRDPKKMFDSQATAKTFDGNRFTDAAFSGQCSGPTGNACTLVETTYAQASVAADPQNAVISCSKGTVCQATSNDPGWFYEYGNACPLGNCNPPPPWTDEKTGSGGTVVSGCATWGSFRPVGVTTGTDPCTGNMGTPVTYTYLADSLSGAPSATCGVPCSSNMMCYAAPKSITAPPTGSMVRISLSPPTGQNNGGGNGGGNNNGASWTGVTGSDPQNCKIKTKAMQVQSGAGSSATDIGPTLSCGGDPIYWLEVSRDAHNCRHVDATKCK